MYGKEFLTVRQTKTIIALLVLFIITFTVSVAISQCNRNNYEFENQSEIPKNNY